MTGGVTARRSFLRGIRTAQNAIGHDSGTGDAVRNTHAAGVSIAGEVDRWVMSHVLLNAAGPIQVADVVLRHRIRPAPQGGESRWLSNAQQLRECAVSGIDQCVVRLIQHGGVQRAAEEGADQDGHPARGRRISRC